jgi:hypothetical protein
MASVTRSTSASRSASRTESGVELERRPQVGSQVGNAPLEPLRDRVGTAEARRDPADVDQRERERDCGGTEEGDPPHGLGGRQPSEQGGGGKEGDDHHHRAGEHSLDDAPTHGAPSEPGERSADAG